MYGMQEFLPHNEVIMVPLINKEQDWSTDDDSGFKIVQFTDAKKFFKYLNSEARM